MNLVFVRKIGYGRDLAACLAAIDCSRQDAACAARTQPSPAASTAERPEPCCDEASLLRLGQALQDVTRVLGEHS